MDDRNNQQNCWSCPVSCTVLHEMMPSLIINIVAVTTHTHLINAYRTTDDSESMGGVG